MDVLKVTPRGYCYGVVDAIQLVKQVAQDPGTPRPIYVLGQIVHNHHVVEELSALGVVTLDGADRLSLLEGVEQGTVIFTAHGVSPAVKIRARAKGLHCVDATCPDVTRTHDLIRELVAQGYHILYVGKRGHPEPEGAMGEAPAHVILVETAADVAALQLPQTDRLAITTQTTLSKWDTAAVIAAAQARWPQIQVYNEICLATQLRQEAAVKFGQDADLTIVVGDARSNNSNRLVSVVQDVAGPPPHRGGNRRGGTRGWGGGGGGGGGSGGGGTPPPKTPPRGGPPGPGGGGPAPPTGWTTSARSGGSGWPGCGGWR